MVKRRPVVFPVLARTAAKERCRRWADRKQKTRRSVYGINNLIRSQRVSLCQIVCLWYGLSN